MKRALAARIAKHDPNGLAPSMVPSTPSASQDLHQRARKIPKIENDRNSGTIPQHSSNAGGSNNNSSSSDAALSSSDVQSQSVDNYPAHMNTSKRENGSESIKSSSERERNKLGTNNQHQSQAQSNQYNNQKNKAEKTSTKISSSPSSITSNVMNSPKGGKLKRRRVPQPATEEDDDDEDNGSSSFFLKHQNAALASELKQLRYQFKLLEKERDFRRTQCKDADQALHSLEATWRAMEVALQLGQQPPLEEEGDGNDAISDDIPRSSGTGESVELIGILLDSLATIMKDGKSEQQGSENNEHMEQLYDIKRMAVLVSKRATALQRWIWDLLKKVTAKDELGKHPLLKLAKLEAKISSLKSQTRNYQKQIAELSKCKDEANASEMRVRRGLYRLSVGRMKLDEVMKAIEVEDEDKKAAIVKMEVEETTPSLATSSPMKNANQEEIETEKIDSNELAQLNKKILELEEISSAKEKHIEQLSKERENNMKRINELVLQADKQKVTSDKTISEDDIKQSDLFTNTLTRMTTAERQLKEVKEKLKETKENWAIARGNAEHATKNLEEQLSKHRKRWAELTNVNNLATEGGKENFKEDGMIPVKEETLIQARMIAELEHKLKQALESVRRADVVRESLEEASQTNETLRSHLEEMKAKNAALMGNKHQGKSEVSSSSSKEASSSSTSSSKQQDMPAGEKAEKMLRRMRRDAAVAIASKDKAKAELAKSEKERESLLKANSRLIGQSKEKDEMNAKSLSTILHLKSLTEKLNQEKELLEQQVKSAGQVNLAARLAANAKDRVTDETLKQRKIFEQKISGLEGKCEALKIENDKATGSLAKKKAEMADLEKDASMAKERCDELVLESTKQQEEKRKILESLEIAKREAGDAARKIAKMISKNNGGGNVGGSDHSEFTTKQLTTQISVLKGRLACPVCNHRDKNCIVTRCRHMFCKPCVEEMVKNRNRKCPSCGQRFDNKDVEDIWL